jgi:hypothetical protein
MCILSNFTEKRSIRIDRRNDDILKRRGINNILPLRFLGGVHKEETCFKQFVSCNVKLQ